MSATPTTKPVWQQHGERLAALRRSARFELDRYGSVSPVTTRDIAEALAAAQAALAIDGAMQPGASA